MAFHIALSICAVDEIRNSRIEGVNVTINKQLKVKDDKFPSPFISGWENNFAFMDHKGKVEFGLDENKHVYYDTDFSVGNTTMDRDAGINVGASSTEGDTGTGSYQNARFLD